MKSKKFKELKVGDIIYFCDRCTRFTKNTIMNGNVMKVKTFTIHKVERFSDVIKFSDYKLGISLCIASKNTMKDYTSYYTYSTSKEFIENEIKKYFKWYVNSLKDKIKEGKKAEKDLSQLIKHNLV